MATYAIGDVHGCFDQLQALLGKIQFDPKQDSLWFTGDLINGGPKSVETLRFIQSLGDNCVTVLGNHDLVLLATAAGGITARNDRTIGFEAVLAALDRQELISWLSQRPLVHYDRKFNCLLVHAGVLPQWDLNTILVLANELETVIRGPNAAEFYAQMFGNQPDTWSKDLEGIDRLRFITNCFTRMRFCDHNGKLDLATNGDVHSGPVGYMPWFKAPKRQTKDLKIIFGHWAALMGKTGEKNVLAIDTGCVWGHQLTALRLDDWQRFTVDNN